MDTLHIFMILQLERIKDKGTAHAPGPKKPNLSQQDAGQRK
jgi:hypothetical protein